MKTGFNIDAEQHAPRWGGNHSIAITEERPLRAQTAKPRMAPVANTAREINQLSRSSNRFWPKSRSCRKQMIKPRLTGARTAISDLHKLALFLTAASGKTPGADLAPPRCKPSYRI
jgi:hypothetical protein